jgi:hypothetical protein
MPVVARLNEPAFREGRKLGEYEGSWVELVESSNCDIRAVALLWRGQGL